MGARLFVLNDASFNNRLYVASDVSFNRNFQVFGQSFLNSDVSMNARLFVNGDASFNNRFYVASDVSFNRNFQVFGQSILNSDVSMNSRLVVNSDVSLNNRLFVQNDVSLNNRLYVGGNITVGGSVNINSYISTILNPNTNIIAQDTSFNYRLYVGADTSLNGNLYVAGNTAIGKLKASTNFALDINGNVQAVSFQTLSDYRIKTNIQELDGTFNVDKLRPVSYYNTSANKQDIGLIAHEIQQYYPYLVYGEKDATDYQSVNYTGIIGVLIHEIKELKKRVFELENKG
jgi:hypothetical protein